ncbi:DODA-type extradiol aromatic ring-opening family dioxygenase [Methylovulum psychrotolerans]|uniref:Dioxygenase n=1 Tax=Methylovulum psychrotolerans TaxID=1704499 RepID=A0A2S5CJY8_9GAMM|nr:class III extradiol ring-cleavage dioxygenase [Methylovulum psychrotolerans]POZ51140.1 dioxygenase [Methylovulum psychrotolerans]
MTKEPTPLAPVLFLSHGGGPLPLLGDANHKDLVDFFHTIPALLGKPAAILVISAHWEARLPTVTSGATPALIYDYYGFPQEAYHIRYPAPGQPLLAERIVRLLTRQGIAAQADAQRGFDHGLFVPLKIMYPEADIPCLQLSLVSSLEPKEHIQIGKALADLRKDNVLIIGSGFSFHNLNAFFAPPTETSQTLNQDFENWLIDTCTNNQLNETEREQRLIHWQQAPAARYCHPREEHLLPLQVCYGAAGSFARKAFEFSVLGKKASAYLW